MGLMQAVVSRNGALVCEAIAIPTPGPGQALLRTRACGICGSDLHALHHAGKVGEVARRSGVQNAIGPDQDLVFGHEFCGDIVAYGPGAAANLPVGARVVALPRATGPDGPETVGFSHRFPGAYAEYVCVDANMLLAAPERLSDAEAAMTEPFAVGAHAVAKAQIDKNAISIVIGCGAVGLAVIAALKARGAGVVVAADYSAARRQSAELMGADVVVDPAQHSPYACWTQFGVITSKVARYEAAERGAALKRPVIFECVGAPGLIRSVILGAAPATHIIVVGVCMEEDRFDPYLAMTKEVTLSFSSAYTFAEFAQTLDHLASGRIKAAPLITGVVSRAQTPAAFEALAKPDAHVKVVIAAPS